MHLLFSAILLAQSAFAPLLGATQWIGRPPAAAAYDGKVVIVDVFTFDCINCKHVVPELQTLRARYPTKDLTIVGVHTPETPSERQRANVVTALAAQGISWPVAVDNDQKLWNAFGVQYWPTQLIFDRHGRLRKTVIGEGCDAQVSSLVAALVAER
ncbi:MAG TPA: thioredoxin-like domain-containing protein [Candidatus Tumulicola sp.]|jgi:thiol-disulfide isomerase/thioredoxin